MICWETVNESKKSQQLLTLGFGKPKNEYFDRKWRSFPIILPKKLTFVLRDRSTYLQFLGMTPMERTRVSRHSCI